MIIGDFSLSVLIDMRQAGYVLDLVQSMMIWVRERPEHYCITAGELDTVLRYLHLIWSEGADNKQEFEDAVAAARELLQIDGCAGLLNNQERVESLLLNGTAKAKVLKYWANVDTTMRVTAPLDKI